MYTSHRINTPSKIIPCNDLVTCSSFNPVVSNYEDWNFNSGNYLFTTDTK